MNIFLSGGTGFIGSYVVKAFSEAGHTITVLARNPQKNPGLKKLAGVSLVYGLMTDYALISRQLREQEACIHIALGWGDTATEMLKNETLPSVSLMEECAEAGVKHFIYTSSTAACGNLSTDIDEERPAAPADYYGATKASAEHFLHALGEQYPMRCNVIRPGYTFGNPVIPGAPQQPDSRFRDICTLAKAGQDIHLIKYDGTQFIWAGDLARLYLAVLSSRVNRQTYFGLSADFTSWEEIATEAIRISALDAKVVLEDKKYSVRPHLYKVDKIKAEFGLEFHSRRQLSAHLTYLLK